MRESFRTSRREARRFQQSRSNTSATAQLNYFAFFTLKSGRITTGLTVAWTDDEIRAYLAQPEISLWLMTYDQETAGYFEAAQV
jgi:hypothetical protein